jgi:hypothetical protein
LLGSECWLQHLREQALRDVQQRRHQVRRAVAPRRLQLQRQLSVGVALHPVTGKRRCLCPFRTLPVSDTQVNALLIVLSR